MGKSLRKPGPPGQPRAAGDVPTAASIDSAALPGARWSTAKNAVDVGGGGDGGPAAGEGRWRRGGPGPLAPPTWLPERTRTAQAPASSTLTTAGQ